jgi:hypothetical protein
VLDSLTKGTTLNGRQIPRVKNLFMPLLLISLLLSLANRLMPQEDSITPSVRGVLEGMLNGVKSDLENGYYDSTFHGIDVEARFNEAQDRLKAATTYIQGSPLLRGR